MALRGGKWHILSSSVIGGGRTLKHGVRTNDHGISLKNIRF